MCVGGGGVFRGEGGGGGAGLKGAGGESPSMSKFTCIAQRISTRSLHLSKMMA